jgi:alpha-tubulin suppressor-like RCC1 family protein
LWSWGANTTGELGTGTIVGRSSPVQVGSLTNWRVVEGGGFAFSAAVKTDGSLWTWGDNTNGQLGLGNVVHRSSPVQVGSLIDWNSITCGHRHAVAIKTDGSLWTWGDNTYGQLGIGDVVPRSSPVQVGSLTTWAQVVAGMYYTVALKTDGTLWSWGENTHGQLGIGDVVHRSSPVQVGSLTVWKTLPKNLDDANFVCLQY